MKLLGDLLLECRVSSTNEQDEQLPAAFLTLHFDPQDVSPNADERLFIFTAYSGAGMVAEYQDHPPTTAVGFAQVWEQYRQWNSEGVRAITTRGREHAIDYLNNILHY